VGAEKIKRLRGLGATPLDDLSGLIPAHVTTRQELFQLEFANMNQAFSKYLIRKPPPRLAPFTYAWLLKLHREMFGHVWEWAGKVRKANLNMGVQWIHIPVEIKKFLADYAAWLKHKHDPLEISVKVHHRLVWIHPFLNGNGRWARMLANIYLRQQDLGMIQWPEQKLFIDSGFKEKYLFALRQADRGEYLDLVELHGKYQG
jgi:Fic-DOC domain mobile mystery protein B